MNLIFKCGPAYIDFPFQTPTSLTFKVLNEKDLDKRLEYIYEYLKERDAIELYAECEHLMKFPLLELTYI